MAALGGSFVPLQNLPSAIRSFSPISLIYWANSGYIDLLRGADLVGVATQIGVLAGIGLLLLAIGTRLLERRILAGK